MKTYQQKVARLVQEALKVPYTEALRLTCQHEARHPDPMPKEARALAIVEERENE